MVRVVSFVLLMGVAVWLVREADTMPTRRGRPSGPTHTKAKALPPTPRRTWTVNGEFQPTRSAACESALDGISEKVTRDLGLGRPVPREFVDARLRIGEPVYQSTEVLSEPVYKATMRAELTDEARRDLYRLEREGRLAERLEWLTRMTLTLVTALAACGVSVRLDEWTHERHTGRLRAAAAAVSLAAAWLVWWR